MDQDDQQQMKIDGPSHPAKDNDPRKPRKKIYIRINIGKYSSRYLYNSGKENKRDEPLSLTQMGPAHCLGYINNIYMYIL